MQSSIDTHPQRGTKLIARGADLFQEVDSDILFIKDGDRLKPVASDKRLIIGGGKKCEKKESDLHPRHDQGWVTMDKLLAMQPHFLWDITKQLDDQNAAGVPRGHYQKIYFECVPYLLFVNSEPVIAANIRYLGNQDLTVRITSGAPAVALAEHDWIARLMEALPEYEILLRIAIKQKGGVEGIDITIGKK